MNHIEFGLIVTGLTEHDSLPSFFRIFMATGFCHFKVIRKIGQISPITSEKRLVKMLGTNKLIPSRDETNISIPARLFLSDSSRFLILLDDLESSRRNIAGEVFSRYRNALDLLLTEQQKSHASVFFFVNMIEAYYFGDPVTTNAIINPVPQLDFPERDVEIIPHPKGVLKSLCDSFDEREDGDKILKRIDLPLVLSNPGTCAWLRTLTNWCVHALQTIHGFDTIVLDPRILALDGSTVELVSKQ